MKKILFSILLFAFVVNNMLAFNVTFQVDMANVSGFAVANVNGTFNGWCGPCNPLTNTSGTIWSATIDLAPGTYEFKYTVDGWAQQENLNPGSPCTITAGSFTNRTVTVVDQDIVMPLSCYSSCSSCSSVTPITFQVDMNGVTGFTLPTINGSFNGWSGNANPLTDANLDGIWETTLSLAPGNYEYKFAADNWGIQENLAPSLLCTVTNSGFTNRSITVGSTATTVPVVCWNACVDCASVIPTYNVTFQVDMSQATGYTIPEVNGTFNGWCGNCTAMADPDNNDIWTVTVPLQAGTYEYKYSHDNWSGQENLTGVPGGCTITAGSNTNRTLNVTGNMTLPVVCYQSCSACVIPTYNVTFQLDMSLQTGFTTPEVNGTFNGWCGNCIQMTDANNDDIWTVTVPLQAGTYEYKYSSDNWTAQENLIPGSACTTTNGGGFTNRALTVTGDMTIPVVCYGSCNNCSAPTYNVTFQVDMSQVTATYTTPEVNGSFAGWCGNCVQMSDANNDDIWTVTIPIQAGTYEYKFSADNWGIQESLNPGSSCTVSNFGFTNRALNVTGDMTLPVVCYGSCNSCSAPTYNVTFQVDMSQVTGYTTPEVNGSFAGWCGNCIQMTDANNDDIWTVTVPLESGTYEFKYSYDNWAGQEALTSGSSCTVTNSGFTNRSLVVGTSNITLPVVCYNYCTTCGPARDNAAQATLIPSGNNWYPQCASYSGNCLTSTNSSESDAFSGPDQWFRFVASSPAVSIQLTHSGMDGALQIVNSSFAPIPGATENASSATSGVERLNFSGLTVGQTYYVSAGAASGVGGDFSLCVRQLLRANCNTNTASPLSNCATFKASWTGANSYTYQFTPVIGSTGGGQLTSIGSISLANAALGIQPGNTYNVIINTAYNLTDGNGTAETITVFGANPTCANVAIAAHASIEVRASQRCSAPATLVRATYLRTDPFVCGATNYTFEFTPVTGCADATPTGIPFTINNASRIIGLNFNGTTTSPAGQTIQNQTYYQVRVRPNFGVLGVSPGTYGAPQTIFIGGTVLESAESLAEMTQSDRTVSTDALLAEVYPNPSNGQEINLSVDNIENATIDVKMFDGLGKLVFARTYSVDQYLNTLIQPYEQLSAGLYQVVVQDGEKVHQLKLVVE
jgi:1,4-alpha-glucan branching enzyme